MHALLKISDLADRYNVTSRTLRYYEEIGLLTSIRSGDGRYRYYDQQAASRLEQILVLRKMQLPIKDIVRVFTSKEMEVLVEAFTRKLRALEQDLESLEQLRNVITKFLHALKEKGYNKVNGLNLLSEHSDILLQELTTVEKTATKDKEIKMEELQMAIANIDKLTDVRIIKLHPMRVAWYRAESADPETDAWNGLYPWVRENGLDQLFTTRYFGFNNPSPTPGKPVYGYEVWVTVTDEVKESGEIKIKTFPGGLYAVTNTHGHDIGETWQKLNRWVKENSYAMGNHQWLEEHIVIDENSWGPGMQLDLYHPIVKKQ